MSGVLIVKFRVGKRAPGITSDLARTVRIDTQDALPDARIKRAVIAMPRIGLAVAGAARINDGHLPLLGSLDSRFRSPSPLRRLGNQHDVAAVFAIGWV